MKGIHVFALLVWAAWVAACEGDPGRGGAADAVAAEDGIAAEDAAAPDVPVEALAIVGSYTDGFGTAHEVTAERWTQTYPGAAPMVFHVTRFDNAAGWVVAQNDPANEYSGGRWSRFDWARSGAALWYCQSAYDADSEDAALAAPAADPTDPANAGCGGFGWTNLTP